MYSEEITGIVIDIGNSSCRAGYSGEDTPKSLFPSAAGILPESNSMDIEGSSGIQKSTKKNYVVGDHQLRLRRDNTEIIECFKRGLYTNFDAVEKLINEIYDQNLQVEPTKYPLLMSEPSIHNKEQRQILCQTIFEKFQVPAYFLCKAAVLSCFASGRPTSLILDTGASSTYVVPVHDGYALQKSLLKYDIGGEYITEKIKNHIEETLNTPIIPRYNLKVKVDADNQKSYEYLDFPRTHPTYENYFKLEIARDIKENICKIIDTKDQKVEGTSSLYEKAEYELPDGKKITIGDFRYTVCDAFFNGSLVKTDYKDAYELTPFKGMQQMIMESVSKCDIDLRKELLSNIIVTGGNSLIPGFVEVLQKKLYDIAPQNAKVKLIAYPLSVERRFSSWIGGSILSSLGSFQSMWIGKAEYDEIGSYVIEKKCP